MKSEFNSSNVVSLFEVEVRPGRRAYYLKRLHEAARRSIEEPGLLRCEVLEDRADPCKLTVMDIFADEAAFQEHLKKDYLAQFQEAVAGCDVGTSRARRLQFLAIEK